MTNTQLEKLVNKYQGKLYFYNGFSEPKLIDLKDFAINSNYQGDVTDELKEELFEYLTENDEDIQEEQPFFNYGIWFMPTLKNLQEFNLKVGLNKDDYLEKMVQEDNLNKTALLDNGVWHYEDQNELDEAIVELEENPDFKLFTVAKNLEGIVEDFEYQGINIDSLLEMTTNHYGNVVEIIYNKEHNDYHVYVGAYWFQNEKEWKTMVNYLLKIFKHKKYNKTIINSSNDITVAINSFFGGENTW